MTANADPTRSLFDSHHDTAGSSKNRCYHARSEPFICTKIGDQPRLLDHSIAHDSLRARTLRVTRDLVHRFNTADLVGPEETSCWYRKSGVVVLRVQRPRVHRKTTGNGTGFGESEHGEYSRNLQTLALRVSWPRKQVVARGRNEARIGPPPIEVLVARSHPRPGDVMGKSEVPAFDAQAFLTKIESGKTTRAYRNKQIVFAQGDDADAVFFVQSGKVKLTVISTRGKEAVIGVLERGSFFGEGCLAGQSHRMSTVSAIQVSSLIRVDRSTMVQLLHREPEFAEAFIVYLLSRNIRMEEDLVDQLFNSSEKRLARILLLLAQIGKESRPESVIPRVSQEMLASMVGTTRSRVSYFMNRFRKLGFIHYNGSLQVNSALLSVVLRD